MILFWVVIIFIVLLGWVVFFGAPYVPARIAHVRKAFDELYDLKPNDLLVDLGSGDGKVLREAVKRGVRAVGYELNPVLVIVSKFLERNQPKVTTKLANMWQVALPGDTTIIYVFTDGRDAGKLAKKIQSEATRLKKPLHVLSYGFELPIGKQVGKNNSHFLYKFTPLQSRKA